MPAMAAYAGLQQGTEQPAKIQERRSILSRLQAEEGARIAAE
jgi:hypothetical protein